MLRNCFAICLASAAFVKLVGPVFSDPLRGPNLKAIAKVKAVAASQNEQDLIRARAQTARDCYRAREKNLLLGVGTLDLLLDASWSLLHAEQDEAATEPDRIAALERYWQRSWMVEAILKDRIWRISFKEYQFTMFQRLGSQTALRKALASDYGRVAGGTTPYAVLPSKQYARAKFEATQADPTQMARDRVEAISYCVEARLKNFVAGISTLDILLSQSKRWLEASLQISTAPADQLAAYERHWERTKFVEDLTKVRMEAARVSEQDYETTRCARLEAEQEWGRVRRVHPNVHASGPSSVMQTLGEDWRLTSVAKDLARAKFQATQSSPCELVPAKLEAARTNYVARAVNYMLGVGVIDLLLKASRLLRDAEYEAATSQAGSLLALEKHWERTIAIENINRQRYESGRIQIQDYLQCVYERLRAQLEVDRPRH